MGRQEARQQSMTRRFFLRPQHGYERGPHRQGPAAKHKHCGMEGRPAVCPGSGRPFLRRADRGPGPERCWLCHIFTVCSPLLSWTLWPARKVSTKLAAKGSKFRLSGRVHVCRQWLRQESRWIPTGCEIHRAAGAEVRAFVCMSRPNSHVGNKR